MNPIYRVTSGGLLPQDHTDDAKSYDFDKSVSLFKLLVTAPLPDGQQRSVSLYRGSSTPLAIHLTHPKERLTFMMKNECNDYLTREQYEMLEQTIESIKN